MKQKSSVAKFWDLCADQHKRLGLSIFLAVLGIVLGVLPYYAAARIIGLMIAGQKTLDNYMIFAGLGLGGFLFKEIFYNTAISISHKAAFETLSQVRKRIIAKLPKLPLGTIMDTSSGRIKQIFVDQVDGMETTLAHLFPEFTSNLFGPLILFILMCIVDWRLALLSLLTVPLGFMLMRSTFGSYGKNYAESVRINKNMNNSIVEYIGGIEVIKAFGQSENSYGRYKDSIIANASFFYNWMKSCQLPMAFGKIIVPSSLILILPFGFLFYLNGSLSSQSFVMEIILSFGTIAPLLKCMNFIDTLAKNGTIIDSIEELLNAEEQQHSGEVLTIKNYDFEMKKVSFAYHDAEVLHDISLKIPEGKMTALVGPSGSGKSTIAKLLAGFWDVKEGSISLGGIDEKKIPLEELYQKVSYVAQENFLFDDTVRENIRMGNVNASDAEVEEAAKKSGCHDFITKLEKGYETRVGSGGAHLSGGEKQRLAIARAMLKKAPIVILDEATAYIDPENEAIIQKALNKLLEEKTVIVIAHRLSTIKNADQIIVVNEGKIEAAGKQEELLKTCPLYKAMWKAHLGAKDE